MPYAINQGVKIHYQVTGNGLPLVLQHGFNADIYEWHEFGYVEKLQDKFRLILVDARGHGGSDKPHDPRDYALDQLVSDITAVLDDLKIEVTHYLGYSMGGWIGFGMAKYASHRLNALIIGGAHPYGRSFENARNLLGRGIEAWMAIIEDWGIHSPEAQERLRKNDPQALIAMIQDRPDMSNILPGMKLPCLLYAGGADSQHDSVERCARELSKAAFVSFPGFDHIEIIPRSDLVVPPIIEFLASI